MKGSEEIRSFSFYIRNIANALNYVNNQEVHHIEITNQQGRLLGAIYFNYKENQPVNRKFLQEQMGLNGASVTSLLNGLEKRGCIVRSQSKEDGRALIVEVTPKGVGMIHQVEKYFPRTEQTMLSDMTAEEIDIFLLLLKKVYGKVLEMKNSGLSCNDNDRGENRP